MKNYCKVHIVGQKETFGEKISDLSNRFGIWWAQNRDWAIIVLPVGVALGSWLIKTLVSGGIGLVKGGITANNLRKAEQIKNLYVYDRSLGHYWKLTRELTSSEWIKVNDMRQAGMSMADILISMKVI